MKNSIRIATAFSLVTLAGCSNAVHDPAYEAAAEPSRRYVVTARVQDAPGPFAVANASARYRIRPSGCMPDAEPISGTFPTPNEHILESKVATTSPNAFSAEVALDGMKNKDYFGKGICTWELVGFSFGFRATGQPGETRYSAGISEEEIASGSESTLYLRKKFYPKGPLDDMPESGTKDPAVLRQLPSNDFFSIHLSAKELGHANQ